MAADTESNKKLNPSVKELLLRGKRLHISLVYVSQSYFKVSKFIRLNVTHYFSMKIITKENFNK